MSKTLIDIFNNILKYNGHEIVIIIDDNNVPWFYAPGVARILEYVKTDDAIRTNTKLTERKNFSKLQKYVQNPPNYLKSNAIFINESGLYSLILSSKKPKAQKFRKWVTSEVLPSIRKTGSYHIEEEYKNKLDNVNKKLKDAKKEIRILKHNQKNKNYKITGLIYIIRPINNTNKKLLKIGKTTNFNKRLNTYNTGLPNNMEVLFVLEVNDPVAVEHCMKGLLHKYVYRKNKEFYECSLKKIREIIFKCDQLVHTDKYLCEECHHRVSSIDHFNNEHQIDDDEQLYLDLVFYPDQYGGINEELFTIPIDNLFIFDKYYQVHLYPYIDHNKTYYQCPVNKIKLLLFNCKENNEIDEQIIDLVKKHNLNDNDIIIIICTYLVLIKIFVSVIIFDFTFILQFLIRKKDIH